VLREPNQQKMLRNIKLVTFDAMSTLFTIKEPAGKIYLSAAQLLYPAAFEKDSMAVIEKSVDEEFKKVFSEHYHKYTKMGQYKATSKQFWHSVIGTILLNSGVSLNESQMEIVTNTLYEDFGTSKYWLSFPEAIDTLGRLQSTPGVKLGVVSNFDERLENVLKSLELYNFFDFVVSPSITEGYGKPDAKIFEKALEITSCKPSETVHIGDDLEMDYITSQKLGINPLLLDTSKKQDKRYDKICSLDEIFDKVEFQ